MVSELEKTLLLSQENVANLTIQLQEQRIQINELKAMYEARIEKLLHLQREKFGRKSERFVDEDQIPLFDLESDHVDLDDDDLEDITYKRSKAKPKKKKNLDDLPQCNVIIPIPNEDKVCACGCEKQFVRYETKRLLHFIPAVFEVENQKREVWACSKGCDQSIVTAPKIPHLLDKCRATESLLSYICVSKILDRQPLYHLEKKIEREHGWCISRQIMARWMILLADKLQPLINLMKDHLLDYDVAAIDATTLQVLNEPGRAPETKSQAYCIRGGPPQKEVTLYEYNAYKQKEYVTELFDGYSGIISADASSVTSGLSDQVELSYCHAHARRKFEAIETARRSIKKSKRSKAGLAYTVLKDIYRPLYDIERVATDKGMSPEQRYTLRQNEAKPILDKWKIWLEEHKPLTLKESPIRKAISYALKHWDGLMVYLTDGRIPIDNNATERDIKPFVIARKNFMFSCTPQGADSLAVHFSLIITAKHHGLDPIAYYTQIFKRIPFCHSISDYEALLPWNFSD